MSWTDVSQWEAAEWAAAASILLVFLTGAYAFLTWRLVLHSSKMAKAASESAGQAKEAAELMRQANEIALSNVAVDFAVALLPSHPRDWLNVLCEGATVYVHGLHIRYILAATEWDHEDGQPIKWERLPIQGSSCPPMMETLPVLLHRGESTQFVWEGPQITPEGHGIAHVVLEVEYSFSLDQPTRRRTVLPEINDPYEDERDRAPAEDETS